MYRWFTEAVSCFFATSVLQTPTHLAWPVKSQVASSASHTDRDSKVFSRKTRRCCTQRDACPQTELLWWPAQLCLTHLNSWGVLHLDRQHLPIYLDVPAVEVTWREHRQVHKDSHKHHRQVMILLPVSQTGRDGAYLPSEGPTLRLIFPLHCNSVIRNLGFMMIYGIAGSLNFNPSSFWSLAFSMVQPAARSPLGGCRNSLQVNAEGKLRAQHCCPSERVTYNSQIWGVSWACVSPPGDTPTPPQAPPAAPHPPAFLS